MLQEHDALPDVQHSLVVLEHTAPQKDEKLPGSQHYRVVLSVPRLKKTVGFLKLSKLV